MQSLAKERIVRGSDADPRSNLKAEIRHIFYSRSNVNSAEEIREPQSPQGFGH